ncbi:O-fucosyltransferase 38, variant 2 [Ancistrocladus abbreviatus]
MVKGSRISSKLTNSASVKFFCHNSSPLSLALCTILLFTLTIFIFVLYSKDILEDQQKPLFSDDSRFHSQSRLLESSLHHKGQIVDDQLWDPPFSNGLHQCVQPTAKYKAAQESNNYMTVRSNGGLNQMRTGIADMVAVARIMNATLVIPQLDKRSFWKDSSAFSDIFDEIHFIASLHQDVRIVKELPMALETVPRARKHFTSWSGMSYYENMTQLWKDYQIIHVAKSDSRLANNDLPLDIQRLRCRTLYCALRFSPSIENLGKRLVERLRSLGGRYIALHLRYEKDMLAFTGCTHSLSSVESEELRILRENTNHWKVKKINSTEQRNAGLCPLTPKEMGIFIQALGYPPSTLIYIAAGEIYGSTSRLSDLTSRFPNVVFKETVATQEELEGFSNHASQTAALDYIISVESDVFIPSYSGNMARAVEGHRRFLGHRKTITPDRKGLIQVFDKLVAGQLQEEGSSLSKIVKKMHKNRSSALPFPNPTVWQAVSVLLLQGFIWMIEMSLNLQSFLMQLYSMTTMAIT